MSEKKLAPKKSDKTKKTVDNIGQLFDNLEQYVQSKSSLKIKQIIALLTDTISFKISGEEMLRVVSMLRRLNIEERSRLHLALKVLYWNKDNANTTWNTLLKDLDSTQLWQISEDVLKQNNAEGFFHWLENQYFMLYAENLPNLDDLYLFSRNMLSQLMEPPFRPYFNECCVQLLHFVSKSYNSAKEGRLPAQKGKKLLSDPQEYSINIAKLTKDLLDVKSEPGNVNQILAIIRSIETHLSNSLQQQVEQNKKYDELKEIYEMTKQQYIETQKELYDRNSQLAQIQLDLKEKELILSKLQSNLDEEIIRNKQKEQFLGVRLTNEKTGIVSKIKGKILFELSEMEEALLNIKDEENKKFLGYFIKNIKKILDKSE